MKDQLKHLGLSNEEVRVYLLLLQKGPLQVTQIAKELSMARSTIYRVVTGLHDKGLVSKTIEENLKIYLPTDPNKLPELLLSRLEEIKNILPELNKIYAKPKEKTEVLVFRGKDGIKVVMNDIITEGKPYTCMGNIEKFFHEVDIFTRRWMENVEKKKIFGRLIGSKKQKFEIAKTEKCRYLPDDFFAESTTVTYGNKTAFFIWSRPLYVVLMDDKEVTKSNVKTFDYLWKQAKN